MSTTPAPVVTKSAYLTLHYRLVGADGTDIVTTFNGNPATLMLGQGQLAPFLENLLIGLPEGTHETFALTPSEGFGDRNPDLIRAVSRATLDLNSAPNAEYKIGDLVSFDAPTQAGVGGAECASADDRPACPQPDLWADLGLHDTWVTGDCTASS